MAFALGDALDDAPAIDVGTDPLLLQLHQLALVIVQLRGEVDAQLNAASNADSVDFDPNLLTALTQELAQYVAMFKQVAAQRGAQNPYALDAFDRALLDVGTWAQQTLAILPNALSALPNAAIKALGSVAGTTGKELAGALVWPGVILVGVLLFVREAEKTKTYRRALR